jgi:hypothetical protein
MKFGKIKVYAHRELNREPIPIFVDNKINRAINDHYDKILLAQTKRRYSRKNYKVDCSNY